MVDTEMAEIEREMAAVVTGVIRAATELAHTLIRLRAEQMRQAAQAGYQQARETRERIRAAQQADAVVWRAVLRPQWWQRAGAEDIARAWRAAAAWAEVDPRADEARRIMVEHLADRGVSVTAGDGARPEDAVWLSEALDRAVAIDQIRTGVAFDDLVDQVADTIDQDATPGAETGTRGQTANAGEAAREQARDWLEHYGVGIHQRQQAQFPQDQPYDPAWQAFTSVGATVAQALEQLDRAENVPMGLRDAAATIGGRMGERLWGLADRLDPSGRQVSAEATQRRQVQREARAFRQAQATDRQERMAGHVRAVWPQRRAERVLGDEAWPVLAGLLDRLETEGQDVRALLGRVPKFVDRAHAPAAYAYRVIDDPRQDSAEARERIHNRAVAARLDEREQRTIEADWRETDTSPPAQEHAVDAHATADADADRASAFEQQAAARAAQGYPDSTREAVQGAAAPKSGGTSTGRPSTARPVRTRTAGRPEPRDRRGR